MMGAGVLIAREGNRPSTVVLSSHAIERGRVEPRKRRRRREYPDYAANPHWETSEPLPRGIARGGAICAADGGCFGPAGHGAEFLRSVARQYAPRPSTWREWPLRETGPRRKQDIRCSGDDALGGRPVMGEAHPGPATAADSGVRPLCRRHLRRSVRQLFGRTAS